MEPLKKNNLKNLKKFLRKNKVGAVCDCKHENELRRALLNSDFFHSSIFIQWKKRLNIDESITAQLVFVSLFSGIFFAFFLHISFTPFDQTSLHIANTDISKIFTSSGTMLQDLHDEGKIRFSKQEKDGTRVYLLKTNRDSVITVQDVVPYQIVFTNASR